MQSGVSPMRNMKDANLLALLSDDDIVNILHRLHPLDVLAFGATCRRARELVKKNSIWCALFAPYTVPHSDGGNTYDAFLNILRKEASERRASYYIHRRGHAKQSLVLCPRGDQRGSFVISLPCAALNICHASPAVQAKDCLRRGSVPGYCELVLVHVDWMDVQGIFTSLDTSVYTASFYLFIKEDNCAELSSTRIEISVGKSSRDASGRAVLTESRRICTAAPFKDYFHRLVKGWVRVHITGILLAEREEACRIRVCETSAKIKDGVRFGRFELAKTQTTCKSPPCLAYIEECCIVDYEDDGGGDDDDDELPDPEFDEDDLSDYAGADAYMEYSDDELADYADDLDS